MNWKIKVCRARCLSFRYRATSLRVSRGAIPRNGTGHRALQLAVALSFATLLGALADDLKSANALYDAGKFAEAVAAYEKIEPKTAHVFFNLGNALFRQEKYGLAILNYERARQLAPRDPDILANLRFAQQRLGIDEPTTYRRFVQDAVASRTTAEWSRYELVALWVAVLAIAGSIWLPRARTGMILVAVVAGLTTAVTAGALMARERAAPSAIVAAGRTEARFAPAAEATVHFQLPEGAKVSIREERGAWTFVERADGPQGWVKSDAIERIGISTAN
jgi:tetratricopeptide (TPR) repeat protein